jgi:hypothetical protein
MPNLPAGQVTRLTIGYPSYIMLDMGLFVCGLPQDMLNHGDCFLEDWNRWMNW